MSTPPYSSDQIQLSKNSPYNEKVMLIAVISLLVIILFVLLLHLFAKLKFQLNPQGRRLVASHPPFIETVDTTDGLDASILASLTIFLFKSEDYKERVECVVCLSMLEDDDKCRILPKCQHAFHVGCIDKWLLSHSTCPICRATVVSEMADDISEVAAEVRHDLSQTSDWFDVGESGVDENYSSEVTVDIPLDLVSLSELPKDDSSTSTSTSPLSCSLKRMLSRSRLECKAFPSVHVNES
ncbi:RING-H2 finger protein ATL60-like [Tasmannia lanceolata]|uniref:RING-H2 finger protein ATL60-like n=1 Tax=Tasmannia lanceolata TaxID=3420 RepID=UPI004063EF38